MSARKSSRKKTVTMKDIATRTGVSITTVSHVINKTRHVNNETRSLVLDAMAELEYDSSKSKKRPAAPEGILALIVADIREDYYVSLVKAIETIASENGLSILLCDSEMDPGKEEKNIHTILERNVSGIIIAPIDSRVFPRELRETVLPVVLVDRQYDDHNRTFVGINNFESSVMAYKHLQSKGCLRIGFIGYSDHVYTIRKRIIGYKASVVETTSDYQPQVLQLHYDKEDSFSRITRFITEHSFDGIICATSDVCYETISALHESHIRIPEDIKVITYDDNKWLDYLQYPVSVVSQPITEIGAFAVETIIRFIESPDEEPKMKQEVMFDVSIIDR